MSAPAPRFSTLGLHRTIGDVEYATAGRVNWYTNRRLATLGMMAPAEVEQAPYAALDRDATRLGAADNLGRFTTQVLDVRTSAGVLAARSPGPTVDYLHVTQGLPHSASG